MNRLSESGMQAAQLTATILAGMLANPANAGRSPFDMGREALMAAAELFQQVGMSDERFREDAA